ncbi:hypothetical protein SAMN05216382_1668 [Sphingomonas palmae]|uniref:Uncharacterized protein n=1 Tax=Sphingomonas palmae TaxID=1855283 RepID=A0A1H7NRW0_9SPHN|nr:hypothetical protein [Sphingomonas palmae]SEL26263.1 hypothetical protein SAMN05216382_1668 [Sphingomonas palmae]
MRTDDDDREYYNRRAEAEIEAASATENPAACRAHYQMAELYLERAYSDESDETAGENAAAS